MDELANLLKSKRKKLKWTIKELAEKANVPYSTILRIERGTGKWPNYIASLQTVLDKELKIEKGSR
jgi:transcriptional regulator with XRE-family HTH domain